MYVKMIGVSRQALLLINLHYSVILITPFSRFFQQCIIHKVKFMQQRIIIMP